VDGNIFRSREDPQRKQEEQNARLLAAAYEGRVDRVQEAIKSGADVNARNRAGDTALMLAVIKNHDNVVHLLLEIGADINARNGKGLNALGLSEWCKHEVISGMLRAAGATAEGDATVIPDFVEKTLQGGLQDIDWDKFSRKSAPSELPAEAPGRLGSLLGRFGGRRRQLNDDLLAAARSGADMEIRRLVEAGARVDITDSQNGATPLMYAAAGGHRETARLLIMLGAPLNSRDNAGRTALIWAVTAGHLELVKLLVNYRADSTIKDNLGNTPLKWAHSFGHQEILSFLLNSGVTR